MAARTFIDTDILIYSVDRADRTKQTTALELIVASAATVSSLELLSGDLNDSQKIQGLTIRNPFL